VLRVVMHPIQSARIGATFKRGLVRALPDLDVQIREDVQETAVLTALQNAEADVAFAHADVSYLAYAGELDGRPLARLRGIATLNTSPLYILVRRDSDIRDLDDLRRRRVSVGPQGSGSALALQIVLHGLGDEVTKSYEPFHESMAKLAEGRVDAVFAVGENGLEGFPDGITGSATRLLSLSEMVTRRLRREHPLVRPLAIPRAVYQQGPISTIGIERLLMCREGLDEEMVYSVTQAFFESLPELSSSDRQLRQMDVENASATPVPLHAGAARYYREQEQM
jgi:TRAP transporter TAXI family solute receptor